MSFQGKSLSYPESFFQICMCITCLCALQYDPVAPVHLLQREAVHHVAPLGVVRPDRFSGQLWWSAGAFHGRLDTEHRRDDLLLYVAAVLQFAGAQESQAKHAGATRAAAGDERNSGGQCGQCGRGRADYYGGEAAAGRLVLLSVFVLLVYVVASFKNIYVCILTTLIKQNRYLKDNSGLFNCINMEV